MKVKTLNKAIEIIEKQGYDVPTKRTLSYWIKRGVLSSYEYKEHLGQQGLNVLYPDEIVAEIIAVIELKESLTLDEIARARAGNGIAVEAYNDKLEEIKQAIK
ncbi:hypothetical protein C8C76_1634 [Halanaerobium saccharolyticum]|uniref:Uncharacterized protein n=1 Tax=Halanaerobium saccharolyticum TaxID=43595 RepID=A0A2T5RF34_9FIRM|nr:hypothetical protein [Halanaerobium saccharolyticum]PTV92897.1 hypothetical protein C8C76_1634 [Halanaerobium saccharolyticum]